MGGDGGGGALGCQARRPADISGNRFDANARPAASKNIWTPADRLLMQINFQLY